MTPPTSPRRIRPSNAALGVVPDIATTSFWPMSCERLADWADVTSESLVVVRAGVFTADGRAVATEAREGVGVSLATRVADVADAPDTAAARDAVVADAVAADVDGTEVGPLQAVAINTAATIVANRPGRILLFINVPMGASRYGWGYLPRCMEGRWRRSAMPARLLTCGHPAGRT